MLEKAKNLLQGNYHILKVKDFSKLNRIEKSFISIFFEIKPHEFDSKFLILEKKQKFISNFM